MKRITLVVLLTAFITSCDDFGDLNVDTNNPQEVDTALLLTNAQRSMSDVVGATTGAVWSQYLAETQYTDASQYSITSFNFNTWYSGPLKDLETMIEVNTNEETRDIAAVENGSNANQIAAARILKAYFYHMMTDRWGAIPYSEALQGRENLNPSYDQQPDIYEDLVNELSEAVAQMDDGDGVAGDIIFSGDMDQWALFANSLRARIALRMADSNPTLAESEFTAAINAGLITNDVLYPYLADAVNENPWYTRFRTRTDYAISDVLADTMIALGDYRVLEYANPAPDLDNNDNEVTFDEINGMPYDAENAGDITNASISFPGAAIGAGGPNVGEQNAPLPIITVAELNFAQAEAAERGWTANAAEELYLAGIEASWMQWNRYEEVTFAAYIAQPEVAYVSAEWEAKIGYQKWIALYPNGYEAWAEWRRLDYPELVPHPFALNASGEIPRRHVYPSTEAEINTESYDAAVAAQGPDTPDTRLWWDVD
ncbi:MAG: SusD/RagB family nutrient-binding outer membrane lipoprotein [Balneolaceae bacterium]